MEPKFETVHTNEGSSFCCTRVKCHDLNDDHNWHYHPEYELIWNIRGTGLRLVGDSVEQYQTGDLVLVGPNMPHCWQNSYIDCSEDSELMVIQFKEDCFGSGFLELPEAAAVNRLLNQAKKGLAISGDTAINVAEKMSSLHQQHGLVKLMTLVSILNELAHSNELAVLVTPGYDLRADINNTNLRRMENIYNYVRCNLGDEINQTEISAKVGFTSQGFSRFFKKYTGLTFVKFVNILRINEACRLLVRESTDITQIAYMCGYQNISNFNRQFFELKRVTPSEFRTKYREGRYAPCDA